MSKGRWCHALHLIEDAGLDSRDLHILRSILSAPKARPSGVFHLDYLSKKKSVVGPLDGSKKDLKDILKTLANKGFLAPAGRNKYASTREKGHPVRHALGDIQDELWLLGPGVQLMSGTGLANYLMGELQRRCEEDRRRERQMRGIG